MNYIIVIKIIYPGFKEVLSSGRGEGPRVLNRFKVVIFVDISLWQLLIQELGL